MPSYVIIGDSHLKLINLNQVQGDATVIARYRISEQILATYRHKNVCFLFVGGNDISFHSTYNPRPKTTQQTADRIISCQIFIEILFRAPKFLKRLKRMLQPDLTNFSCEKMFADIYLITFSNNCNLTTFYEVCNDFTKMTWVSCFVFGVLPRFNSPDIPTLNNLEESLGPNYAGLSKTIKLCHVDKRKVFICVPMAITS